MPLVILCGRPSSGKSHLAAQITSAFQRDLADATGECKTSKEQQSTLQSDTLLKIDNGCGSGAASSTGPRHADVVRGTGDACGSGATGWFDRVVSIGDEAALIELGLGRNDAYESTHKLEKRLRGNLKAATERALADKRNLVILDHGNYIKGWRYELYCMAKSTRSKTCVVYVEESDVAKLTELNTLKTEECRYSVDILKALAFRFEAPNTKNRWDSPLISTPTSETDVDSIKSQIITALYKTSEKVKPHDSTQAPIKRNITDMESVTQHIIETLIKARQNGERRIKLPSGDVVDCPGSMAVTDGELRRARRNFFNYIRQQNSFIGLQTASQRTENPDYAGLFIKFLNSSL